jgi:chitinase
LFPRLVDQLLTNWHTGEIADIAEIAATPALIQLCVKSIEKEGKAEFKIFGKKHTLSMDKPTAKPTKTRPPESSHTKPHTSTDECGNAARDLNGRAPAPKCNKPVTSYYVSAYSDKNFPVTKKMVCDFNSLNQACMNYASIIDHNPGYDLITCPFSKSPASKLKRPIVALYNRERGGAWVAKITPPSQQKGCERDEWPPAALHEYNNGLTNVVVGANVITRQQYVRLLDGVVNGKAGNLWKGCPKLAASSDSKGNTRTIKGKNIQTKVISVKRFFTRSVFSMGFANKNDPDGDNGLKDNPCQPFGQKDAQGNPIDNRGFALLNEDSWFNRNPAAKALTAGWKGAPNWKRDDSSLNLEELVVVGANSSRRLTERELQEQLGIYRCEQEDCRKEMEILRIDSALNISPSETAPAVVLAVATTLSAASTMSSTPRDAVSSPPFPRQTFNPQT